MLVWHKLDALLIALRKLIMRLLPFPLASPFCSESAPCRGIRFSPAGFPPAAYTAAAATALGLPSAAGGVLDVQETSIDSMTLLVKTICPTAMSQLAADCL